MFEESVNSIHSIWVSMNSWLTSSVLFVLLNVMIGTIAITSSLGSQKHRRRQEDAQEHPQRPQLARSPSMLQRLKSITLRSQEPTPNFGQNTESETHFASTETRQQERPQLTRSPSMLQRLKPFNLSNYLSKEPNPSKFPSTTRATTGLNEAPKSPTHYSFQPPQAKEVEKEEEEDEPTKTPVQDKDEQEQNMDDIYVKLQGTQFSRTHSDTKPESGEILEKLPRKIKKAASDNSAFAHFEEDDVVETSLPAAASEGKVGVAELDEEVDARANDFINNFKHQLKLERMNSIMNYKEVINRGSVM